MATKPPPLYKRIRALRAEHGMSRTELQKRTKVSLSYLQDLERGPRDPLHKHNPSMETLQKISKAFGLTPAELLGGQPDKDAAPQPSAADAVRQDLKKKIDQLEIEELTQLNELLLVIKKHKNPARLR
jgi:transcriptional regulator with XRE-family HTH domain